MKILYVASAVVAPGSHGGATHVVEVARELMLLGHELHVVCARPNRRESARLTIPVANGRKIEFYRYSWPKFTAWATYPQIKKLADQLRPDLIMERYYNFAGGGMLYAHRHQLPAILEVNALMLDPLSSLKRTIDRLLLFDRLKWWTEKQCTWASRIVTPLHTTVPASIPRDKIVELPWGANVELFDRAKIGSYEAEKLRAELGLPKGARVAAFAGSFRHWHGIITLLLAAKRAIPQDDNLYFLLIGGGPLYDVAREEIKGVGLEKRVILTGPVPYQRVPLYLSLADCGVAPFDTSRHAPLREAGFYWSPLKIFEYMALGLPSIVPDFRPLNEIIRPQEEGVLFREADSADLSRALLELLSPDPAATALRQQMGQSARARVVEKYSWRSHCLSLDSIIKELCPQS
jgi:glycosyltransferase involved in cell wall biosynthesis